MIAKILDSIICGLVKIEFNFMDNQSMKQDFSEEDKRAMEDLARAYELASIDYKF